MNARFALITALTLGASGAAWAAAPAPTGVWLDGTGRAAIDIEPCGDKLCGSIVWLKVPLNEQGKPKTDIHNPDAGLQQRPLCGVPILWGFTPDDDGWSGGMIYDPASGKTYKSNMHLAEDGTLRVRGYIGISWIGRTESWTKAPSGLTRCK